MDKIIHLMKVGMSQLSNHEVQCIESWKRVYPDFEIKVWTDETIKEYAQDCEYARDNYERKRYAYVIDYTRLKFLYEYGGIYMDTDVFCINRIPDSYFETTFISWDDKFCSHWSNNGCFTYVKKGDPIVYEWIEKYRNLKYDPESPWHNNWPIDLVLKEKGFNFEKDKVYGSLKDIDIAGIKLVNRIQFGVNDYMLNRVMQDERTPYCQHCHALSWMGPYASQTKLYYGIINDDTDIKKFSDAVDEWIKTEVNEAGVLSTLVIYVNTLNGFDKQLSKRLLAECPRRWKGGNKFWFIQPLGAGIEKKKIRGCVNDFLLRRYNSVLCVKDIMKGR